MLNFKTDIYSSATLINFENKISILKTSNASYYPSEYRSKWIYHPQISDWYKIPISTIRVAKFVESDILSLLSYLPKENQETILYNLDEFRKL